MRAHFKSRCVLCKPNPKPIRVGDEIVPHPNIHGKWVHRACGNPKPEQVPLPLRRAS